MDRAEIRRFLRTTIKTIRYYTFCTVTIETELLDNLGKRITMVLIKQFRTGIPACTAAHASHAIDNNIHHFISFNQ